MIDHTVDYRHRVEEAKTMNIGTVYRLTYYKGKLISISEIEKDCSVAKFHQKFDGTYTVVERNKVWCQTILTEEEAKNGQGISYTLMNPAYGIYLSEEDFNLHRIDIFYKRK